MILEKTASLDHRRTHQLTSLIDSEIFYGDEKIRARAHILRAYE